MIQALLMANPEPAGVHNNNHTGGHTVISIKDDEELSVNRSIIEFGGNVMPVGDEEEEEVADDNRDPTEFECTNAGQNQIELASINTVNSNHGSSILAGQTLNSDGDEQNNTRSYNYSDPKDVTYMLRVYPFLMGLIVWKFTQEKPASILTSNPFLIISLLTYIIAYLNLVILSWMYDLLKPPTRLFSLHLYMILRYSFYILCILAHFSLLPILFIPYHQK